MLRYIVWILLWFSFLTFFWFLQSEGINILLRNFWWVAFVYLCLSLLISPLVELTGKQNLRPYRKVFWILAFFLALIHWWIYFYYEFIYNGTFFVAEHFSWLDVFSWIVGLVIISLLWITSLNSLHRAMGKYWKSLHTLVFPLFCIVALHVAFASRFDVKYMIFITLVVFMRVFASIKVKNTNTMPLGKYVCVPCGYIYDSALWDPDSWVVPWTPFEDIPNTWRCPICWVTKADFIPFSGGASPVKETRNISTVSSVTFLNPSTVQFSIDVTEPVQVIPWQFAKIILTDGDGEFSRLYSVVKSFENTLTFCVKVWDWRGSKIISRLQVWQKISLWGIYGNFVLNNTLHPKVFIATGTWLAPIMNMLSYLGQDVQKYLYFWVRKKEDLFYEDEIKNFIWLTSSIFLSQENSEWYTFGRIDIWNAIFPKETEFYVCWNFEMVKSYSEKLKALWYSHIYIEKFS